MSKYLKFYKKCMKTGELPNAGLCGCFINHNDSSLLDLFSPMGCIDWYWGYDGETREAIIINKAIEFTPLRQTIVLFMHEMSKK